MDKPLIITPGRMNPSNGPQASGSKEARAWYKMAALLAHKFEKDGRVILTKGDTERYNESSRKNLIVKPDPANGIVVLELVDDAEAVRIIKGGKSPLEV